MSVVPSELNPTIARFPQPSKEGSAFTPTAEQRAIIESTPSHMVVTAVAGSGKTTTLAHRIHHLLGTGIHAKRILILMFNRKAKEDFNKKLGQVCAGTPNLPEVRTFHSMGYRLYSRFVKEGALVPFQRQILTDFEIQYQLWRLIRLHAPTTLQTDIKKNKKEHVELAETFLSGVKSSIQSPEQFFDKAQFDTKFDYLITVFHAFEAWRREQQRISYDDMLYEPVHAALHSPNLVQLITNKMDIILVDEYQDTNEIQHQLLRMIAGERAKVTVVGDPDQTIYEFRGAKPEYMIRQFSEEFPGANTLTLSHSFRYGHGVSLLANQLIHNNQGRQNLLCKAHADNPNTRITLKKYQNCAIELSGLLSALAPQQLQQSAILVRTWSQSVAIELQCLLESIPYRITDKKGVFNTAEIRAISGLLELAAGVLSSVSAGRKQQVFEQILRFPHVGIPEATLHSLAQRMGQESQSFGHFLMAQPFSELKAFQRKKLEQCAHALTRIEHSQQHSLDLLWTYVDEVALFEGLRNISLTEDLAEERVSTVKGFLQFLRQIDGPPSETLHRLSELKNQAQSRQGDPNGASPGVEICTIHRAKGLEWNQVFVPHLAKEKLPYTTRNETLTPALLESERRLLYVAMTRSKQSLHLLAPQDEASVSPFLSELNFEHCAKLAQSLYDGEEECVLKSDGQPSDSHHHFALLERYIAAIDAQVKLNVITTVKPRKIKPGLASELEAKGQSHTLGLPWINRHLHHCQLGLGQVIEEQGNYLSIKFASGQTKKFPKKNLHLYFIPAETASPIQAVDH